MVARVSVDSLVRDCEIQIGDMTTMVDFRITTLGAYDVVLDMDWLYAHNAKMDYRQKRVECADSHGTSIVIFGIQRPVSLV